MKKRRVIKVSPSIIATDYVSESNLDSSLKEIERAGADFVHLDVMDGKFVPSTTFNFDFVEIVKKKTKLVLDVHLMVKNPESEIDKYVAAGADIITVHYEACKDIAATLKKIKSKNVIAGVAINPETSVLKIKDIVENRTADLVNVMTVKPGASGQAFMPKCAEKIIEIRELNRKIWIEVDGGVNTSNASMLRNYGANILVSGSCVFKSKNMKATIEKLKGQGFVNKFKAFFSR